MKQLDLKTIKKGGKRSLADALSRIEEARFSKEITALLDDCFQTPKALTIGITGPPGVGKSTLINALVSKWRKKGKTIGIIAVDPSSHKTGGALLGDRTRFQSDPGDKGVFFRSLASKGMLGGLSAVTFPALVLMRALFDVLIIETVGVGQSEADIADMSDIVALCVQPGSGDSLQFMKAGIMEIPDIAIVTKADFGPKATRTASDLEGAIGLKPAQRKTNRAQEIFKTVYLVSSVEGKGIDGLIDAFETFDMLINKEKKQKKRTDQGKIWLEKAIKAEFGQFGWRKINSKLQNSSLEGPFTRFYALSNQLITMLES